MKSDSNPVLWALEAELFVVAVQVWNVKGNVENRDAVVPFFLS